MIIKVHVIEISETEYDLYLDNLKVDSFNLDSLKTLRLDHYLLFEPYFENVYEHLINLAKLGVDMDMENTLPEIREQYKIKEKEVF